MKIKKFFNDSRFLHNSYFLYLIILFYYLVNLNYLFKGGISYDDWSLATGYLDSDFVGRLKINILLFFNTRPVGGLYVASITGVGKNDFVYIFLNSGLWLLSGLILYQTIAKALSYKTAKIFIILFLFPSFASTPFFSPVTQSLGGLSIFFWSLSIYFSYKKKFSLIVFFYILSVLSYEISVVLFLFNIFFFTVNDESFFKKEKLFTKLGNLIIKFSLLIFCIVIFQFVIAKLTGNSGSLKYAFGFIDSYLIIEEDFFLNIKKYFFKPVTLIFFDIPNLFFNSLKFIEFSFYNFLIYLVFFLTFIIFIKDENKKNNSLQLIIFFIFILLLLIFVFFMYLIVTSVPQVNGYYNRGLLGLFICFALFISLLNEIKIKNTFTKKMLSILIFTIVFLNLNSFIVQKNNNVEANIKREEILKKVKMFFKDKESSNLIMMVPTYLKNNYNDETIFSEEVDDLHFAVNYSTNNKINARRVFYSKNCEDIIKIVDDSLYGYVPSRSRKKPGMIKIELVKKLNNKDKDLYLFYKNKFFKLKNNNTNNNKILSKNIKCSL